MDTQHIGAGASPCVICREALGNFEDGRAPIVATCGHAFCMLCLDSAPTVPSCPSCGAAFDQTAVYLSLRGLRNVGAETRPPLDIAAKLSDGLARVSGDTSLAQLRSLHEEARRFIGSQPRDQLVDLEINTRLLGLLLQAKETQQVQVQLVNDVVAELHASRAGPYPQVVRSGNFPSAPLNPNPSFWLQEMVRFREALDTLRNEVQSLGGIDMLNGPPINVVGASRTPTPEVLSPHAPFNSEQGTEYYTSNNFQPSAAVTPPASPPRNVYAALPPASPFSFTGMSLNASNEAAEMEARSYPEGVTSYVEPSVPPPSEYASNTNTVLAITSQTTEFSSYDARTFSLPHSNTPVLPISCGEISVAVHPAPPSLPPIPPNVPSTAQRDPPHERPSHPRPSSPDNVTELPIATPLPEPLFEGPGTPARQSSPPLPPLPSASPQPLLAGSVHAPVRRRTRLAQIIRRAFAGSAPVDGAPRGSGIFARLLGRAARGGSTDEEAMSVGGVKKETDALAGQDRIQ